MFIGLMGIYQLLPQLVDSAAHFHVQQQANCKKIRNEGGASITHKRQRYAGDGEDSDGHADIKNYIEGNGNDKP